MIIKCNINFSKIESNLSLLVNWQNENLSYFHCQQLCLNRFQPLLATDLKPIQLDCKTVVFHLKSLNIRVSKARSADRNLSFVTWGKYTSLPSLTLRFIIGSRRLDLKTAWARSQKIRLFCSVQYNRSHSLLFFFTSFVF